MEKIWNKTKPVTKKLLSLCSDINVVHSCMMYKIIIINDLMYVKTRLGQLGANISPDRSSLTPQVLIGNFLFNPFVVCHKYWEKLYELQHINLLSFPRKIVYPQTSNT